MPLPQKIVHMYYLDDLKGSVAKFRPKHQANPSKSTNPHSPWNHQKTILGGAEDNQSTFKTGLVPEAKFGDDP